MKGHIRSRGKSGRIWEIKVDAGRDPFTGKRDTRYIAFHGTKREAQSECARIIHEIKTGQFVQPSKLTVGEYLEQWLSGHAKTEVSPKTYERYAELLRHHVIAYIGALPLTKLRPPHIQTLRAKLLKEGRRSGAGGLAPQTVKHVYRVLRQALAQAVRLQLIVNNPADAVEPPKVEFHAVETLDDRQAAVLLHAVKGTRMFEPILLALTTGLRRGELLALRWQDIDLDGGVLSVQQSLEQTKDGLRFKAPKTKRSRRTITLPSTTLEVLRAYKARQLNERVLSGVRSEHDELVFSTRDHRTLAPCPTNPRNFTKEFGRIAGAAGLPSVTFHALRHTHITQLLRLNVHPKIASERAGHASVAITLDIYSHVVPNMQADAAKLVDENIRRTLKE